MAKVPTYQSLNKMNLDELNRQIDILGKRINQRMKELRTMEYEEASFSLFRLQKLAAEWTPEEPKQLRYNFSRAKAKSVSEGRARVKNLIKGLSYKTSTRSGIKTARLKKKESFAQKYIKTGGITDKQWGRLTDLFNRFRTTDIESGVIVDVFFADEENDLFETTDDLIAFIEEKGEGVYRRQLGSMKRSKHKYRYNQETGKFESVDRNGLNDYEQLSLPL